MTTIISLKIVTLNKTGEVSYYFTDLQGLTHALSEDGFIEAADGFEYTRHNTKRNRVLSMDEWIV